MGDPRRAGQALHGVGIDGFTVGVVGELETATIELGKSVIVAPKIEPDWQRNASSAAASHSTPVSRNNSGLAIRAKKSFQLSNECCEIRV